MNDELEGMRKKRPKYILRK